MNSIAFLWILNLLLMNTGLLLACRRQDVGLVRPHHLPLSFVVVSWFLKFHICFSSKSASILYPFEVGLPLLMFKPDCSRMKASENNTSSASVMSFRQDVGLRKYQKTVAATLTC